MSKLSGILLGVMCLMTVVVADRIIHDGPGEPVDRFETRYNVQVLRTISDYRYLMRDTDGTIYHAIFCENYEPQFDAGETLVVLTFEDRGDCWDIRRPHSYTILRDRNGYVVREKFAYDDTKTPVTQGSAGAGRSLGPATATQTPESSGSH